MRPAHILLIDDDLQNLRLLEELLSGRYRVTTCSDPQQGIKEAQKDPPAAAVLDLDMPGMSGFEVCEALRSSAATRRAAILFVTSDPQAASMQTALKLGADDYLVKPFRAADLLARLERHLGQQGASPPLSCGNLSLDPASLSVTLKVRGSRRLIQLTHQSIRVLELLIRNEGRLLSREQIIAQAWSEPEISDRAVDLQIFRLRKALGDWSRAILSVYGRGYMVAERKRS
jgi:DNA-binding response OmpR family regulator